MPETVWDLVWRLRRYNSWDRTMDLLVTGANGQLGHEVARLSERSGLTFSALTRGSLDIRDRQAVFSLIDRLRPKVIVNAAAYTAVDKAENEASLAFAVNRDGPKYLAEAAERIGAVIIHVSTDYVFDGRKSSPYRETDGVAPLGVYGHSKEAGERAVREATERHYILRTAWVFGEHTKNFVKTMLRLASERDELFVVDDQKGSPTYATDLAEAVLKLAAPFHSGQTESCNFGTFHCAGAGEVTWCGFARTIFSLSSLPIKKPIITAITTEEYPTPAKRPANSALDCARLETLHGLRLRPWQEALSNMLSTLESK